jgi:hypothetical protein
MAKTTITQITDDLDGSNGAETYSFAWQGIEYTVDLSNKNFKASDKLLRPYIEAGQRVPRRSTTSRRSTSPQTRISDIREWARSQGLEVSERGRIPKTIVEQYQAAR